MHSNNKPSTGFSYPRSNNNRKGNVGGSVSLPNLRPSFRKMSTALPDSANQSPKSQFKNYGSSDTAFGSRFRSNSSPSIMNRSSFFSDYVRPAPAPVLLPSFPIQDGFKNGSNVQNSAELIVAALRAGYAHFQRGMHHQDIMALVRSASKSYNSSAATITLNRTLEKLVASGIVSQSYGERPRDATYRLVLDNPNLASITPTLIISGTKIKSNNNVRFRSGQCLPGGRSHLARPAITIIRTNLDQNGFENLENSTGNHNPLISNQTLAKNHNTNGDHDLRNSNFGFPAPPSSPTSPGIRNQSIPTGFLLDSPTFEHFRRPFGAFSDLPHREAFDDTFIGNDFNMSDDGSGQEYNGNEYGSNRDENDPLAENYCPSYDNLLDRLRSRLDEFNAIDCH